MNNNEILKNLANVKNMFLYFVEKGDDLKSIADRFNTTQSVLIAINNLDGEVKYGQYILIEKLDGEEYVVMPGDTFEQIAHNDIELAKKLKSKNKTDCLYVGQKIYI